MAFYKGRGFVWLPILIGILVVLSVSGGAYWYEHSQAAPQAPVEQQSVASSTQQSGDLTASTTTNTRGYIPDAWGSYTNKQYGFYFQYPSDFYVEEEPSTKGGPSFILQIFNGDYSKGNPSDNSLIIYVYGASNSASCYGGMPKFVTIGNQQYEFEEDTTHAEYSILHDSDCFVVHLPYSETKDMYKEIFETFYFTDSTSVPSMNMKTINLATTTTLSVGASGTIAATLPTTTIALVSTNTTRATSTAVFLVSNDSTSVTQNIYEGETKYFKSDAVLLSRLMLILKRVGSSSVDFYLRRVPLLVTP